MVTLLQLVLSLIVKIVEQRKKSKADAANAAVKRAAPSASGGERPKHSSERKCALCMEQAVDLSATQCGHLFCWVCILNWLDERQICPICREAIKKSRVVRLQNY